jgi:SAM-dependent methyltransferase
MRRLLVPIAAIAIVAAVVRNLHRPAGRVEAGGVLVADASGYERMTGWLLGSFYAGVATDVAAVAPPGARVLDVGSGPGHLASRLADHGLDVVAIDLDPAMVAMATKRLAGRAETAVASVTALPFADASFDVVVSTLSMHHWADPAAGLTEIARVLRPGGRALVWDLAGRGIPLHGHVHDPAGHVEGTPLEVAASDAWRWPGPLSLTRRLDLRPTP